jgi:hypothetical protein
MVIPGSHLSLREPGIQPAVGASTFSGFRVPGSTRPGMTEQMYCTNPILAIEIDSSHQK